MLVLCFGIPKSGSTLAFEMVKGVLASAGHEQAFVRNDVATQVTERTFNFMQPVSEAALRETIAAIGPGRMIAVKTHAPLPAGMFRWVEELQANRALQIVASFRDPRDNCLALIDAGEEARRKGIKPFSQIRDIASAVRVMTTRIEQFRRWGAVRGTLRLAYETAAFRPDDAIAKIEGALGVTSDHERVKAYAFHEAKTLRNKAIPNRSKSELSREERSELTRAFRDFIRGACHQDAQEWYETRRDTLLKGAAQSARTTTRRGRKIR